MASPLASSDGKHAELLAAGRGDAMAGFVAIGQGCAPTYVHGEGFGETVRGPELLHGAPWAAADPGGRVALWGADHAAIPQPQSIYGEGVPVPAVAIVYQPGVLHATGVPVAPWIVEHGGASHSGLFHAAGLPVAPWIAEHGGTNHAGLFSADHPGVLHATPVPVAPWGTELVGAYHPASLHAAPVRVAPWYAGVVGANYPELLHATGLPVAPWHTELVGTYHASHPAPGILPAAGVTIAPWDAGLVVPNHPGLHHATAVPVAPWGAELIGDTHPGLLHGAGIPFAPWGPEHAGANHPGPLRAAAVPVAPWGAALVGANFPGLLHATPVPVAPWAVGHASVLHPGLLHGARVPMVPWGAGLVGPQIPSVFHRVAGSVAPWPAERVRVHQEVPRGVGGHGARGRVGVYQPGAFDGIGHGAPVRAAGHVRDIAVDAVVRGAPVEPPRQMRAIGIGRGAAPQARQALPAARARAPTPAGQGRRARRHAAQSLYAYKVGPEAVEEEDPDPETHLVRPPEGEGPNQHRESVVEENQYLSGIYVEMIHNAKSIRQLVNKRREVQQAANDFMDWSSISVQVHDVNASINMLLDGYDTMLQQAERSRIRIRSLGGHPVEPPVVLSEHPRSWLKL